jgi:DNA invertase Pin-like site-specific DNA recombinase
MSTPNANSDPPSKFVSYVRVSTQRQGVSGLGLEAQTEAVARYVAASSAVVVGSFTEAESGKKAHNRPQLQAALELCRREKATLLIAKLDRLARNVHFISGLLESGVAFVAADAPSKDRFMLHVQAAFAEEEARRISLRTREALAAAKRRGVQLGATGKLLARRHAAEALKRAQSYADLFAELERAGARTTKDFRDMLNARGVSGPGGGQWHLPITHRTLKRLGMGRRTKPQPEHTTGLHQAPRVAEVAEL